MFQGFTVHSDHAYLHLTENWSGTLCDLFRQALWAEAEMIYCFNTEDKSLVYFGIDVFCPDVE
jgi:hypothetical protein